MANSKKKAAKANAVRIIAIILAALNNTKYPDSLLATVIRRVKTDSDDEKSTYIRLNDTRTGIIKACRKNTTSNNGDNAELEKKRQACKKSKWYMGLVVLIVAGICLFFQFFHPFVLIVTIIICAIIGSVATASYSKIYKNQVIASILKNFDKDLQYMPDNGIRKDVYRIARFESFDRYHTEDLIANVLELYQQGDVSFNQLMENYLKRIFKISKNGNIQDLLFIPILY